MVAQECVKGLGSGGCQDCEGGGDWEDCHGASSRDEGDDDPGRCWNSEA